MIKGTIMKKTKKPYYQEFAEEIIKQLESGTAPWIKPWEAGQISSPYNPVSGTVYQGGNLLRLMMASAEYHDPRWMTFKQAQSVNAYVKKGETATRIRYFIQERSELVLDTKGEPLLDKEGNQQYRKNRQDLSILTYLMRHK